jgi:hypothetical protein
MLYRTPAATPTLAARRQARLLGRLTGMWSARIARTLGYPDAQARSLGRAAEIAVTRREHSARPSTPVLTAELCLRRAAPAYSPNPLDIVFIAEQFVQRIETRPRTSTEFESPANLPSAILRALREEYPGPIVDALAAQFCVGTGGKPQAQRSAGVGRPGLSPDRLTPPFESSA